MKGGVYIVKPIGILYATCNGHTRRIAEHIASKLRGLGFNVELNNVAETESSVHPLDYSAVVLAASVHMGAHEREMVRFVKEHVRELNEIPTAFISVTLTERGVERPESSPAERARFAADVQRVIDKFFTDTGWRPERVKPVAGALLYTKYNLLLRFVMRQIAKTARADTDTSQDYEYTDWAALDRFVEEFSGEVSSRLAA